MKEFIKGLLCALSTCDDSTSNMSKYRNVSTITYSCVTVLTICYGTDQSDLKGY